MKKDVPSPKYRRFERVHVAADSVRMKEYSNLSGTVVWLESQGLFHGRIRREWLYVVHLPSCRCYPTFWESELQSEGAFDSELAHRGVRPELSFDIILEEEENQFIEGVYRLPGEFWKVLIFQKADVPEVCFTPSKWCDDTPWEDPIDGMVFRVPRTLILDRTCIREALALAFGYTDWMEVRGPDSMMLR